MHDGRTKGCGDLSGINPGSGWRHLGGTTHESPGTRPSGTAEIRAFRPATVALRIPSFCGHPSNNLACGSSSRAVCFAETQVVAVSGTFLRGSEYSSRAITSLHRNAPAPHSSVALHGAWTGARDSQISHAPAQRVEVEIILRQGVCAYFRAIIFRVAEPSSLVSRHTYRPVGTMRPESSAPSQRISL